MWTFDQNLFDASELLAGTSSAEQPLEALRAAVAALVDATFVLSNLWAL